MSDLSINNDFESLSREDWMTRVQKGLKGAEFESLIKKTDDDLIRGPFFSEKDRPEKTAAQLRLKSPLLDERAWHMCSPVRDPDIQYANKQQIA